MYVCECMQSRKPLFSIMQVMRVIVEVFNSIKINIYSYIDQGWILNSFIQNRQTEVKRGFWEEWFNEKEVNIDSFSKLMEKYMFSMSR